jgi:hypothetical protein
MVQTTTGAKRSEWLQFIHEMSELYRKQQAERKAAEKRGDAHESISISSSDATASLSTTIAAPSSSSKNIHSTMSGMKAF